MVINETKKDEIFFNYSGHALVADLRVVCCAYYSFLNKMMSLMGKGRGLALGEIRGIIHLSIRMMLTTQNWVCLTNTNAKLVGTGHRRVMDTSRVRLDFQLIPSRILFPPSLFRNNAYCHLGDSLTLECMSQLHPTCIRSSTGGWVDEYPTWGLHLPAKEQAQMLRRLYL